MSDLLFLRKADEADCNLLFEWVNEKTARGNAFDSHMITVEEHKIWFERMLDDDNQIQYILMKGEKPVGQIRLIVDGTTASIEYSISLGERAYGYGNEIIRLTIENVRVEYSKINKLIAKVKPSNVASFLCFRNNGFEETYLQLERNVNKLGVQNDNNVEKPGRRRIRVLFLTNNRNTIDLFEWIKQRCDAELFSDRLTPTDVSSFRPELVISYNYNYLISSDCIRVAGGRMINMHISLLPWNRGFSPNIWSFIDDTPKGVTIHILSEGLDEGDILFQKEEFFDPRVETFQTTYDKLNRQIVELFKSNWDSFISGEYLLLRKKQSPCGSYHSIADLKRLQTRIQFKWTDTISDFLERYNQLEPDEN